MDRLIKSYLVLIMGLGTTLVAFYLGFSMLVYLVFPLVLIAEISFVLLTYIQESVPPVDENRLRNSGWAPDPDMETLELGNQVYYLRGDATIYGELKGGTLKILTYWDGSGDLWRNEEVSEEIIAEILDTHTPTHTHTQAQADVPSPSESLEPESPDTHTPTPTHTHTQAQAPENPRTVSQVGDDRAKCKSKEEKEKEKERPHKKGSALANWLEDLRSRNIEKLNKNYSPAERRLIEEDRKRRADKKAWRGG